jgi:integrase
LQRIPPNATKKFPEKSLEYAAEQRAKHSLPGLNPQTINSHLNKMSTLFNWAVKEELMDKNPAVGLAIEIEPHSDEDGRRSFTRDELKAIFNAPLFTGCRDDERNFSKPGPNKPRRSRFWIPLIALFAGMRQNEICQLLPSDIDEIAGIPVIRVQKTKPWQKLKSRQARRVVPIHPELIRIGLLNYVRDVRKVGSPLLFPDLKIGPRGYMSEAFQKRFNTFLKSIYITDGDATFHSFRHTWRDALRQARAPEERVQAVGGWTGIGQDKRYGDWFENPELIEEIAKEIAKVEYRGLDLSHL